MTVTGYTDSFWGKRKEKVDGLLDSCVCVL